MTLEQWCRARKQAEHLAYLDKDTKGYFEAMDLIHTLAKALGDK